MRRAQPEQAIHVAVLDYLRTVLPGALVSHSPNEFAGSGPAIARQMAKHRWMGTCKGWPDLEVALSGGMMLFFEVKSPAGRLTDDQAEVIDKLDALGHLVAVVRSVDDVRRALKEWGIPSRERTETFCIRTFRDNLPETHREGWRRQIAERLTETYDGRR